MQSNQTASDEASDTEEYPYSFYCDRRHQSFKPKEKPPHNNDWRIREKLKTVSVSLVLCLNIGVDPPDLVKTKPCAKMECWIDPFLLPGQKALEAIGRNLQSQYEAWQPRARYRLSLDPTIEETKKLCCSLRRNAKDDRILFHYNGHGVPKPTVGGEIWVFNKSYTQYIPVSVYDIQSWLGSPCIFVYDCSSAGHILSAFNKFAVQRDSEAVGANSRIPTEPSLEGLPQTYTPLAQCIQLAACRSHEVLPMSPDMPADLFTSCLTTPIEIALRWFVLSNPLIKNVTLDMTMKIPGRVTDRRTPLGELNWIFTSITDTIAWSVLPTDLFLRLFRNDLMVAALFRNFLLADRIMRHYNCHPMSSPSLPETHQHPMWEAWDLAADHYLAQLPALAANNGKTEYKLSSFFSDQLSAFEVWIKRGGICRSPPQQLPIVLQVLLSQVHRLRALLALSKFLDFGKWAVDLALSVGIFPYVLKLLQSPAMELRPVLVFIWAKLLAVDSSCRNDLLKDNGYTYFVGILSTSNSNPLMVPNLSEHRAMCVFILSVFCDGFLAGKQACLANDLLPAVLPYLTDQDSLLRQWTCVCLGNFWAGFPDAKWAAINSNVHVQLSANLLDPVPEVRAAALSALGLLLGDLDRIEQVLNIEQSIVVSILKCLSDASPFVRLELVCALSRVVKEDETRFIQTAYEVLDEERKNAMNNLEFKRTGNDFLRRSRSANIVSQGTSYETRAPGPQQSMHLIIWKALLTLSVDPFPHVASSASSVVDTINTSLLSSNFLDQSFSQWIESKKLKMKPSQLSSNSASVVTPRRTHKRSTSSVTSGIFSMSLDTPQSLKRSSSYVFSLKSFGTIMGLGSANGPTTDSTIRNSRTIPNSTIRRPQSMYASTSYRDTSVNSNSSPIENLTPPKKEVLSLEIPEIDDPGSLRYSERQWRYIRNQKVNQSCERTSRLASSIRFGNLHSVMNHDIEGFQGERQLLFHPYDPYLLVSDSSTISVMDWEEQMCLHVITNNNPSDSKITTMKFINEEDFSLLMVGSGLDEGVIRLYKDYYDTDNVRLLTAWRSFSDLVPGRPGALVTEWHQPLGLLYTSGSSPIIRVWDAEEEMSVADIPTVNDSRVTNMSIENTGAILLVGFADGSLKLFDRRMGSDKSVITKFTAGRGSVLTAKFINGGSEFISGTTDGSILLFDIRQTEPVQKLHSGLQAPLSHVSIHDQSSLVACGTSNSEVSILNKNGANIGSIKPSHSFLNRQIPFLNGLAFHPKKLLLTTSSLSTLSFYQSDVSLVSNQSTGFN
ncbi:hypothetical protein HDV02_001234 [Globomyces sp. JEL0801]|nr:hypothetical protein HDV02_001234 [Globomyces sp. JEL0801]